MWTYRIPGSSQKTTSASLVIRLSLILMALPMCAARLPVEKWECGPDIWPFSDMKKEAHEEVMKACPHFAADINHCCVVHDDCYGRKKGQDFCDDQLEVCNKKVLEDERAGPCKKLIDKGLKKVRDFGSWVYGSDKITYTEPDESKLPHLCRPEKTMGVFFDYLYLSCPTIKKQISSCCDQLTLCPDLPLDRNVTECAFRAMRCLVSARAEEHHGFNGGHCDRALDRTRKYLALDYIMENSHHGAKKQPCEIFPNSNLAFVILLVLSMLCSTCLFLVTYNYYLLRSQDKERNSFSR